MFKAIHFLLSDVFENFRNMCLEIYELDPAQLLSVPGFAWQGALKKTKMKLDLLINIDMLLMVQKCIRGGICHSIYRYGKANNKHMKDYDKNKESSYLKYYDANNLYGWVMSQKLPVCHSIYKYEKAYNKYMKDYDKNKELSYFKYWDVNNLYG